MRIPITPLMETAVCRAGFAAPLIRTVTSQFRRSPRSLLGPRRESDKADEIEKGWSETRLGYGPKKGLPNKSVQSLVAKHSAPPLVIPTQTRVIAARDPTLGTPIAPLCWFDSSKADDGSKLIKADDRKRADDGEICVIQQV